MLEVLLIVSFEHHQKIYKLAALKSVIIIIIIIIIIIKNKLKQVASVGNEMTIVNSESHICLNCEKGVKHVAQFYRYSNYKSGSRL